MKINNFCSKKMWHSNNFYLPPNLTTKGHVLAIDYEIMTHPETVQKIVEFLTASFTKGYSIVVMIPYDQTDSIGINNARSEGLAKSLGRRFPAIVITGNQGMSSLWGIMESLIQIKSIIYIGTGTGSNDATAQELVRSKGGNYYTDAEFFQIPAVVSSVIMPSVVTTDGDPKPYFNLPHYLASKTKFKLFFEEARGSSLRVNPIISVQVSRSMYQKILTGPTTSYKSIAPHPSSPTDTQGNAYFFGPEFPIDQYILLIEGYNNGAEIGFIDNDLGIKFNDFNYKLNIRGDPPMERLLGEYNYKYDDRELLRKIRQYYPQVVWIGEIEDVNGSVELFAHYNTSGEIDSLLVDAGHFLGPEPEESI